MNICANVLLSIHVFFSGAMFGQSCSGALCAAPPRRDLGGETSGREARGPTCAVNMTTVQVG